MNLVEFQQKYGSEAACLAYLEASRWPKDRYCPHCGSLKTYKFTDGKLFKCGDCRKQFTAKVGTIFSDSKIPLYKWFLAIYLATSLKKGISSVQLSKYLGVTQKTAWFMLQRIRFALEKSGQGSLLQDVVEVDETYIGGKSDSARRFKNKSTVMGAVQKKGLAKIKVVDGANATTAMPFLRSTIDPSAEIQTDESSIYLNVKREYRHKAINHSLKVYSYNGVHTNTIEGFWSHLKRGIDGVYHHVSAKHLPKYCKEYEYRYNTRDLSDIERFNDWFGGVICRLTYRELING